MRVGDVYDWSTATPENRRRRFQDIPPGEAAQIADIALPLTLAYAILRHRVLDVGFALNRTVVYAAVTTVVVVAVSLVDWLAAKLIGETRLALAAEAAVTIALGVALNAMHERIGRFVERLLFRARHTAERRLRNGIEALAFAASDAAIERALTDEVSAGLGLRSTALFRLDEETKPFPQGSSDGLAGGGCHDRRGRAARQNVASARTSFPPRGLRNR